jgi:hypothetical protein
MCEVGSRKRLLKEYRVKNERCFITVRKGIKYIAKDSNGQTWGYVLKPVIDPEEDDTMWLMREVDEGDLEDLGIVRELSGVPWKKSLRKLTVVKL